VEDTPYHTHGRLLRWTDYAFLPFAAAWRTLYCSVTCAARVTHARVDAFACFATSHRHYNVRLANFPHPASFCGGRDVNNFPQISLWWMDGGAPHALHLGGMGGNDDGKRRGSAAKRNKRAAAAARDARLLCSALPINNAGIHHLPLDLL